MSAVVAAAVGSFVVPSTASAQSISIVSGNNQVGTINTPLAVPLSVRATSPNATPLSGVTVFWSVTSGSGVLASGTSVTNTAGVATNTLTPTGPTTVVKASITDADIPGAFVFFTETATPAFDYSLANSGGVTIPQGASGATTITATLQAGATQPVSFAVSGLPNGATANFSAPSCSPTCSTTLTITTATATPTGISQITVTGSPLGRTTSFTLTVNPQPFDYSLAANPGNVTLIAGGTTGATTITATLLTGSTRPVSFSVSGLPAGATATFSAPSCSPTCTTTLTLTATTAATLGTSTITVTGGAAGAAGTVPTIRTTTFTFTVIQQFDYSLAASPTTVTLTAGGAPGSTTITATLLAASPQSVGFSVSGLPAGATATFSAPSCSPTCTTTLTITAAATASAGTSTITVAGSPLGRTTTFTLTVNAPRTLSIVSGNNQIGVINAPLPKPLVVSVTPPTPSVTVIWAVAGGARASATETQTVNGLAQIALTLGPTPGPVTVTASIGGTGAVSASSVTFVVNDATQAAIDGLKTYTVLGNLAVTTATVQSTNIGLRLAARRSGGGGGASVSGLSLNVAGQSVPLAAAVASFMSSGPGGGASADPSKIFGGLGIFLNGQGSFGDQEGTTREPGFKFHTEGLTLGADYQLTANVVLGVAAGYLHTAADLDQAGGRAKMSGYSLSAFGTYYVTDKFYVDAIATYGWNDYGITRNVTFGDLGATAKADPDGNQLAVSVAGGYNFNVGRLTVGPTARVNYVDVRIDGFQERGADLFNLRVNSQRIESLTTDLGAQLSYAISLPWGVLSPLVRAEWEHEIKGGSRLITGSLAADPLRTPFGAPTNTPDRNYVNLAAGVTATLPRGASAFVHYETVLGRAHATNHSFTAGVRFQFE